MRHLRRLRPSPAMVVACLALSLVLGGTSYAAVVLPAGSVGTKQLKRGAVTAKQLKANVVSGAKVKDGSLTGVDVRDKSLTPADFSGSVQGPPGPPGPEGPPNPNAVFAQNADKLDDLDSTQLLRHTPSTPQILPSQAQGTPSVWMESGVNLGDNIRRPSQFKLQNDGGFLVTGALGIGTIPASGDGERMLWHPFKSAFRAGSVDGSQWDDANVGFYSWAGGFSTVADGIYSLAHGNESRANGQASTAMGINSRGTGIGSTAIGVDAGAIGSFTTALGRRAATAPCLAAATCTLSTVANNSGHPGSFVYGDNSTTQWLTASADNQFSVRAAGGIRLFTNSGLTTGCQIPAGSGTMSCTSDRNAKRDFAAADPNSVLDRLARLPVSTWSYKTEKRPVRHMGPTAQDFRRAFGLGSDERRIDTVDAQGVTMAAAQGLHRLAKGQQKRLDMQQSKLAKQNKRLDLQHSQIAQLERRLADLEQR